jgi:hypothetical protein
MGTFTTAKEAREFLEKRIKDWNLEEESEKIIKLANALEKSEAPKITTSMRKDVLEKNLNALNSIRERNLKIEIYDNPELVILEEKYRSELDEVLKVYVPPVPRKRTTKKKDKVGDHVTSMEV